MLKLLALFIGLAHAQEPLSYLVFPTADAAIARTEQQCHQYGCVGATDYWWMVQPLTDGTAALVIHADGPYGPSAQIGPCTANCGLTLEEQANLKSEADMAGLLPKPPEPPPTVSKQDGRRTHSGSAPGRRSRPGRAGH